MRVGPTTHDDVVVLSLVPYGEADLVVRLFTRARGRLGAFARAARKSKKRFGGLSAPGIGRAGLAEKHNSDLVDLIDLDVDARVFGLASDLKAWGFASYVVELVERSVPEHEPDAALFERVVEALLLLARHGADARLLRSFELKLLAGMGYLPDLASVDDEPGSPSAAYDPTSGRLLAHAIHGSLPFAEDARRAAMALLVAPLAALPVVDEAVLRAVGRLFAAHLRAQGGAPLRSVEFLASIGRGAPGIGGA